MFRGIVYYGKGCDLLRAYVAEVQKLRQISPTGETRRG